MTSASRGRSSIKSPASDAWKDKVGCGFVALILDPNNKTFAEKSVAHLAEEPSLTLDSPLLLPAAAAGVLLQAGGGAVPPPGPRPPGPGGGRAPRRGAGGAERPHFSLFCTPAKGR